LFPAGGDDKCPKCLYLLSNQKLLSSGGYNSGSVIQAVTESVGLDISKFFNTDCMEKGTLHLNNTLGSNVT
jgi:hypothetical protein